MAAAKERESALSRNSLDKASRERLEEVLSKEPAALTQGDREFLWGRRDYLTADECSDYGVDESPYADPKNPAGNQDEDEDNGEEPGVKPAKKKPAAKKKK